MNRSLARATALLMLSMSILLAAFSHAATFTVTNINDAGVGSLRQAITDSNADNTATVALPHSIQFAIAGAGVKTIAPTSQFPFITRPVVIDGYTQLGSSANTLAVGDNSVHLIELDGTNGNIFNSLLSFEAGSGGSIARGLVINRTESAVFIGTGNVKLEGNFFAINVSGTAAIGNAGINIGNGLSSDAGVVVIGGSLPAQRNVIAGPGSGIVTNGLSGVVIAGNYIGTNAAGTAALGGSGIVIGSQGVVIGAFTIGGLTAAPGTGAGNVISGNTTFGVRVNAESNTPIGTGTIQGNIMGLAANGVSALGGGNIVLNDASFRAGNAPTLAPATIGGAQPNARNVISGNVGIAVSSLADGVTLQQNYMGTDITGTLPRGNSGGAIRLEGAGGVLVAAPRGAQTIGGVGAGNVIAGNGGDPITLIRTTATVRGNLIGTRADGVTPLANAGRAIDVQQAVAIIGGTVAGEGNTITASGSDAIRVAFGPANSIGKASILGNSIYQNGPAVGAGGLGINNLPDGGDGVTPNDAGDADVGGSGLQNYPVIVSATAAGNVQGTLNSTANTTFRVEFFANAACDSSGFGEGQTLIGFQLVTTDGSGNANFNASLAALPVGQQVVTSTATDPSGNTSEFSSCRSAAVAAVPTLSINNVTLAEGNIGTTAFNFTVTLSAASATAVTVNYNTSNATATAGSDYAAASGTLTLAPGVLTQSITVNVNGDTTIEPDETFLVTLSAPVNATIGVAQGVGTGTIVNDDAAAVLPTLSINNVSQNEGNSGLTPFVFTVTLSAASATAVTVNYATSDGSANAGSDYNTTSGTLTFAPNVLTQTISVNAMGDTLIEGSETFVVTLTAPTNATLATAQGVGSIINDDAAVGSTVVPVPTLGGWALIALGLLLAVMARCAARVAPRLK